MEGGKANQLEVGWKEGPTDASYFLSALRRQIFLLVSLPILAGGLALVYAAKIEPLYTATAEIGTRLDPEEISALSTHIELIQSEPVTLTVINNVGLEPVGEIHPGGLRRVISAIRDRLNLSTIDGVAEFDPTSALIRNVVSGLEVQRVGDAALIMISYTSESPDLSAEMANAYARAYVDQNATQVDQSIQHRRELLERRAEEARQSASDANRTAENILVDHDFILVGADDLSRRITEFRERLSAVSAESAAIEARLMRIPSLDPEGSFEDAALLSNETAQLFADLKAASTLLARLQAQPGIPESTTYQLDESVAKLRSGLVQAVSRYREDLVAEQAVVAARRASILAEREQVMAFGESAAWTELMNAERRAITYEGIYQSYLQDLEDLYRQGRNVPVSFVSQAYAPTAPSFPNYKVLLAFGVTFGIVLAGAIALLREWQRRSN